MTGDQLDVPLEDATLLEEVELISTLMIAASESDERLEAGHIDRLLGVRRGRVPDQPGPRGASAPPPVEM